MDGLTDGGLPMFAGVSLGAFLCAVGCDRRRSYCPREPEPPTNERTVTLPATRTVEQQSDHDVHAYDCGTDWPSQELVTLVLSFEDY